MRFKIRFFCNFLQSSNISTIALDDSEDTEVWDLKEEVYKKYETEFKGANVGISRLEFFALVRPICIEAYCWKRLLVSPTQYPRTLSKHLLNESYMQWRKTKMVMTSLMIDRKSVV